MNATLLITGAGVVLTGLVTYLVAARRMSGKIATSDASDLWTEANAMRTEYRTRITELNGVVQHLEDRIDQAEQLVISLRNTITGLEKVIAAQKKELGE